MIHSWSNRPEAARRVREAALAGNLEEAARLLGEESAATYAADVLASLRADIARVQDRRL